MESWLLLNEIIYRPIFNFLVVFLKIFNGNMGLAIISLTLFIRLLMIKQSLAQNDMQKGMGNLQPKLQEIQEKYKNDPQKLSQETMKVFKTDGKGPLKGCLMMLVQIPVFLGLFYVIKNLSDGSISENTIYSFFWNFGKEYITLDSLKTNFLGIDLLSKNNLLLTIIAAGGTYLQMKLTNLVKPTTPQIPGASMPDMSKMMGFMGIFMAFLMGSFVWTMQSGVGLYIAVTTLFSVIQYIIQYYTILKVKFNLFVGKKPSDKPEIIETK